MYIGSKVLNAKPMNLLDYNNLRGWDLPNDEDGTSEGYLVEYLDGGKANVEGFDNYVSWSPREQFERAYHVNGELTFSDALLLLKGGLSIARKGWNEKDMFLFLVEGSSFEVNRPPLLGIFPEGTRVDYHAHIDMKNADGQIVPWVPSQTDLLTNDWLTVS